MPSISLAFVFLWFTRTARLLQSDSNGVVAIVIALMFPVALGLTALAADVSLWSSAKNSAQGAADNAVLSAVVAAGADASSRQINNEALGVAALQGFTNGQNGVTVTLNNPPKLGNNTTNANAYEVIVTQKQNLYFAALLGTAPTVTGRAVGAFSTPVCVLALDPSANNAIGMSGGSTIIKANNCDLPPV